MSDGEGRSLQQTLRDAWLGTVGAVSSSAEGAEARIKAQLERLVEAAGAKRSAIGGQFQSLLGELVQRAQKSGEALERRVDDGVKLAVARVRAPIDDKVALLERRLQALGERVEARRRRRAAASAATEKAE